MLLFYYHISRQTLKIPSSNEREMSMDDKKRVKNWEKIFSDVEDSPSVKTEKRLNVRENIG